MKEKNSLRRKNKNNQFIDLLKGHINLLIGQKVEENDSFGLFCYNEEAIEGLWLKVHASRRQKDPRNAAKSAVEHGAA